MYRPIAIILGILILAGCEKPAELAHGHALPDLVFAANAPELDPEGAAYAEAVWTDGLWKIHEDGMWRADCRSGDDIFQAMREIRDQRPDSRVLISAGGNTPFREIVELIRNTARAGFWRVDFLVATGAQARTNHSFTLKLPTRDESDLLDVDPLFISLDAQGVVHTGRGAARTRQDTDPADHALPKLNGLLEIYTAAAKAASSRPVCQVYADPDVAYQRVIDLMARFHEHGIVHIYFSNPDEYERTKRLEKPATRPRPPRPQRIIPLWSPPRQQDE